MLGNVTFNILQTVLCTVAQRGTCLLLFIFKKEQLCYYLVLLVAIVAVVVVVDVVIYFIVLLLSVLPLLMPDGFVRILVPMSSTGDL